MQTQYLYNPNEEKIPEVELYRICYPVTYKEFLENKKEWIKCSTVKLTKDDLYLLNNNSNNNNNNLNNNNSNSSEDSDEFDEFEEFSFIKLQNNCEIP